MVIIITVSVLLGVSGEISYGEQLNKVSLSEYDNIISRNYITSIMYVDYREILKGVVSESEEVISESEEVVLTDEDIQQSHENYLEFREKEKDMCQI